MARQAQGKGWGRRFRRLLVWSAAGWVLIWYGLPWCFPWPEALSKPPPASPSITDRHGVPLRRLLAGGQRANAPLPLERIPQALIRATMAAEDKRFRSHGGVDLLALARAVRDTVVAQRAVSGASTITQQLVKLAQPQPRTLWTKLVEAMTARRVEMTWSKDRIMEEYLNRLSYGSMAAGCGSAALTFLDKPLEDCSMAECALLAGLPQAPARLSPWRHPDAARRRQVWVLERLRALGWISEEEAARAAEEKLKLEHGLAGFRAPHFVDYVLERHPEWTGDAPLQTTLDLEVQQVCEDAIRSRLALLVNQHVNHAAAVVMDNVTGEVLAMTGSPDYRAAQVNGATARRSPGSALKPFTYLLALQQGWSPATILPDLPVEYMTETGLYRPGNYNHRAAGPVSLRVALACSLNLAAVRLLRECGGAAVLRELLRACGINTLTKPAAHYGLGLTIGSGEVTLLGLTGAYSVLARLGTWLPPQVLTAAPRQAASRIADPDACWLLADVLSDAGARVRTFGAGPALRLPFRVAVKTGTSSDYRDNWTVGYTPRYTVGVWAGNFDGTPMRGVSGVTGAAPIFRDIFSWLESRHPLAWYEQPQSIVGVQIDPLTGLRMPMKWREQREAAEDFFRADDLPGEPGIHAYDETGRVLLPRAYAAWLAGPDNWLGQTAAITTQPPPPEECRIISPLGGTVLYLDPDLPGGGSLLPLRSAGVDEPEWSSKTLTIRGRTAVLTPGRHEISLRDPESGLTRSTWVEVRKL